MNVEEKFYGKYYNKMSWFHFHLFSTEKVKLKNFHTLAVGFGWNFFELELEHFELKRNL